MLPDLGESPEVAIQLCRASHVRLVSRVEDLTDGQARAPSRLPGWTVGHVLTHLARNADGHARRLRGTLRGQDVPRYQAGQRDADITVGAGRPAADVVSDLRAAQEALELVWAECVAAGWPNRHLRGSDSWESPASPARRLREVEVHHVDLGLGYEPSDWPEEYVAWDLPVVLASVPGRAAGPDDARDLLAWVTGRGPVPSHVQLAPW